MVLSLAAEGAGAGADDPAAIDRLPGADRAFLKNLPRLRQMTADVREGRPAAALAVYGQLPPELQKDKTILMLRLQAAQISPAGVAVKNVVIDPEVTVLARLIEPRA